MPSTKTMPSGIRQWAAGARWTTEGRNWLLAAGMLFLTGWVKGINLILLLSYLMLVLWVLNFLLAGRRLSALRGRRRVDSPIFAQMPTTLRLELHNPAAQAHLGLFLEERGPHHGAHHFILRLDSRQTVRFEQELMLPRRGRYVCEPLRVSSSYPFGLVQRSVTVLPAEEIIVLPQLGHLHRGRFRMHLAQATPALGRSRHSSRRHPLAQTEFHGLRPFRPEDSPRGIHWRTSARRGELMVREFEEPPTDNLILIVEAWLPCPSPRSDVAIGQPVSATAHPGTGTRVRRPPPQETLEDALSLAATICWEWCRHKDDRIVLGIANSAPIVMDGLTGRDLAIRMLEWLAVQTGDSVIDASKLLEDLAALELPPGPVLVVTTHASSLTRQLEAHLHRPIACIDVSDFDGEDFYERAGGRPRGPLDTELEESVLEPTTVAGNQGIAASSGSLSTAT